jgi:hypothetical protein
VEGIPTKSIGFFEKKNIVNEKFSIESFFFWDGNILRKHKFYWFPHRFYWLGLFLYSYFLANLAGSLHVNSQMDTQHNFIANFKECASFNLLALSAHLAVAYFSSFFKKNR